VFFGDVEKFVIRQKFDELREHIFVLTHSILRLISQSYDFKSVNSKIAHNYLIYKNFKELLPKTTQH
jgi:hypothetical protein